MEEASKDSGQMEPKDSFTKEWEPMALIASSADYYFNSYNHYGVHEDVLKDYATTSSFHRAIIQNSHLFRGAVVLEVCAGLGLCALMAAQAGAKRVIALESQAELVEMGTRVARKNGFGPEVLEFYLGDARLERLPDDLEQVDIIVSEWMGYFMLYEARLNEVVRARDRWLKPGGLIFPDKAKLHMAVLEDPAYVERHFEYFNNVWGFDFSPLKAAARSEPVVSAYDVSQLLTTSACVHDVDLNSCSEEDCYQVASRFQLTCKREGKAHGLLFWFDVFFDACHKPVCLLTGPEAPATCWKQAGFFFQGPPVSVKHGEKVRGMVAVRKHPKRRDLDIKIAFKSNLEKQRTQLYRWN